MTTRRSKSHHAVLFFLGFILISCSNKAPEQITKPNVPTLPPSYEGYHDITNCTAIMAWAWDANNPNVHVDIDIYDGETKLTTAKASDFREDLKANGKGNGEHGLTYIVPPSLKDGKPHNIRMKFAGTKTDLTSTPKTITCTLTQ